MFVHLPSFPVVDGSPASLPNFLQGKPVASINYRWTDDTEFQDEDATSTTWPTPVHDTAFAYSWLVDNLTPEGNQRRDIYVYGSYLGASLATSLALTESYPHMRFAVRGGIAYNGIYNWTMFLPDHPINRPSKRSKSAIAPRMAEVGSHLHHLQEDIQELFPTPAHMFDPFASPSLLFHNPGVAIPSSFYTSMLETAAIDSLANMGTLSVDPPKIPRKSHMVFPPRQSTLKIPELLLLHDSPVMNPKTTRSRSKTASIKRGNSFHNQAQELAELTRRSIEKVELKERSQWDDDVDSWKEETERRIAMMDIGEARKTLELGDVGEAVVRDWLEERVDTVVLGD